MPPKRKSREEEEEEGTSRKSVSRASKKETRNRAESSDEETLSSAKSKPKSRPSTSRDDDSADEESVAPTKNTKTVKKPRVTQSHEEEEEGPIRTDDDGKDYIDLGKMKRGNVSEFKGNAYVNIREYYNDAEGNARPGKKGIMLTADQWKVLKENADAIDRLLRRASKK